MSKLQAKQEHLSGLRVSEIAWNLWKIVNILVDRPHATCTTPEMIAKVREITLEFRRQTIHDVCNRVGLSHDSCRRILVDKLNVRRIAAKTVRFSNNDQRDHRIQVRTEQQNALRHDPNFLSRVITGDES